jgi:hypothetical protein
MTSTSPTRRSLLHALVAGAGAAALLVSGLPVQASPAPTAPRFEDFPAPLPPPDLETMPEIRALADDAFDAFTYSFAAVAADPARTYPAGTVETALRQSILAAPQRTRDAYTPIARQLVDAPVEQRVEAFGRHGGRTAREHTDRGFAAALRDVSADRDGIARTVNEQARTMGAHRRATDDALQRYAKSNNLDLLKFPALKTLSIYLESVKCVDETNPETGDDEIYIGGLRTDAAGNTTTIGHFTVGDEFDDGEVVNYGDPGHEFTWYGLQHPGDWPRNFMTTVMIAEGDNGGFAAALSTAWMLATPYILDAFKDAVAGVVGELLGEAIGAIMGSVVGWLLGKFADWIISVFEDDLFKPGVTWTQLPHRNSVAYLIPQFLGWTNLRAPTGTFTFNGHGGSYKVNVHWQVRI